MIYYVIITENINSKIAFALNNNFNKLDTPPTPRRLAPPM